MALLGNEESRYYFVPKPLLYYTWRFICAVSGSPVSVIDAERELEELQALKEHLVRRSRAHASARERITRCVRLHDC